MMLNRPQPGETENDLLRQDEELVAQGTVQPSVTLVKPDKRKNQDASHQDSGYKSYCSFYM